MTGRVLQSRGQFKKAFRKYIAAAKIDLDKGLPLFKLYRLLDLLPKSGVKA